MLDIIEKEIDKATKNLQEEKLQKIIKEAKKIEKEKDDFEL